MSSPVKSVFLYFISPRIARYLINVFICPFFDHIQVSLYYGTRGSFKVPHIFNFYAKVIVRDAFNRFPDFFVQAFKIVVHSWNLCMLLLYILWDDW